MNPFWSFLLTIEDAVDEDDDDDCRRDYHSFEMRKRVKTLSVKSFPDSLSSIFVLFHKLLSLSHLMFVF